MIRKFLTNNFGAILSKRSNFPKFKGNLFSSNCKIFILPSFGKVNTILKTQKNEFSQQEKPYKEVLKDYEQNKKKASTLIQEFQKDLNNSLMSNEEKLFSRLKEINDLPVGLFEYSEFRQKLVENIEKFAVTKNESVTILFSLLDKLEIDDNLDKTLSNLSKKIVSNINTYDAETLSVVIYTYSKARAKDEKLWSLYEKTVIQLLEKINLRQLSQILISFTMVGHKSNEFYKTIMKRIEKVIDSITHLDNSRICFSLTRGILPLNEISESTIKKLQDNFASNTSQFNLFQISKILLLFGELPTYNQNIFSNTEMEITKEYLNQVDEIVKENTDGVNLKAFFDDLTTSMLTFSIKRKGSKFFWSSYLKCVSKFKDNLSVESMENLLFIVVQVSEMLGVFDITKDNDLNNVMEILKEKIFKDKLLIDNRINPFNLMMTLSTLRIENNEIWGLLIVNILKALRHENFKFNSYLLSDLAYGFGTYETTIINNSKPHELFEKNRDELWDLIINNFNQINQDQFDVLQIANIAWYFSQLGLGNQQTWDNMQKLVYVHLNNFDQYNYLLVCMALSAMDINNIDLWKKLEDKGITMINNFNLEDLRKLIFAFLKVKDCKKIWVKIEESLASDRICAEYNLGNFCDLQLPLAVTEVRNPKIWQKFEEIVFKNIKDFEKDNDLLMNTVYAFFKINQGSEHMWRKFSEIIKNRMDTYDADDLGHIVICMNKFNDDNAFWEKFLVSVANSLPSAKINACNNLLKGIALNKYLKDNTTLKQKIEDKIQLLLAELKK